MGHFAKVVNGQVTQVIVAEPAFFEKFVDQTGPGEWIQTSYNTFGGVHYGLDGRLDGGVALRKNYAGIGYIYDRVRDAFYPQQPFPSWTLDENTCTWQPPYAMPVHSVGNTPYYWDEPSRSWKEME